MELSRLVGNLPLKRQLSLETARRGLSHAYILSGPVGNEQINLLEINTTPGMTATSFIPQQVRAAGLSMADVLTDIIEGKF